MSADSGTSGAAKYRRVVLKISGEGFVHPGERGISVDAVLHLAEQTYAAARHGVELAIVLGGGNILRGAQFSAGTGCIHEATAHYMGMLATVMNGLALQDALESLGADTRLMTAIRMDGVAEPYIRRRARRHLPWGAPAPDARVAGTQDVVAREGERWTTRWHHRLRMRSARTGYARQGRAGRTRRHAGLERRRVRTRRAARRTTQRRAAGSCRAASSWPGCRSSGSLRPAWCG